MGGVGDGREEDLGVFGGERVGGSMGASGRVSAGTGGVRRVGEG